MRITHNNILLLRFRYLHFSTFRSRFNDRRFFLLPPSLPRSLLYPRPGVCLNLKYRRVGTTGRRVFRIITTI